MIERIPCISLHQPWCFWVALGWKQIETRTHRRFESLLCKRIGIHASLTWDKDWLEKAGDYLTREQISATQRFLRIGGALICTAYVNAFGELCGVDTGFYSSKALIDCSQVRRYGLFLGDVQKIEAVPMKGRQGIWYAEVELNAAGEKVKDS